LAQAREDRIRARNGFAMALDALNTAIGAERVDAESLHASEEDTAPPPVDPDVASSVEQRPEWLAARHALHMQEENLRRARGGYAPTIHAFGNMDWDSDRASDFERSYVAGVMAEWDLFDGGRRSQEVTGARAQHEEARALLEQTRQHLALDIRNAQLESESAHERLTVTGKTVESAEESLRITRQRYEQGAVDITELLNAEVALAVTRMRKAAARYEYLIARANVDRARGDHQ
jgi:outer membrane protein TolC